MAAKSWYALPDCYIHSQNAQTVSSNHVTAAADMVTAHTVLKVSNVSWHACLQFGEHVVSHCRVAPVMGAGYHTLHHTVYNKNYGHYFIYMDKLHGTLFTPEEDEARKVQRKQ